MHPRKLHSAVVAVVISAALATSAHANTTHPPVWWITDALCVHSGWHYTSHRIKHVAPGYVLWGHGYWRTWDVPDNIKGGSGEGGWDADGGYGGGGLQMDSVFQSKYGPEFLARWGSALRWPVWAQLVAGYRGWKVQGWGAWPWTSRACGLR